MNELQTAALPPILTDSGLANQRLPRQPKSPKVRAGPVEGPSRVGHFFRPGYGTSSGAGQTAHGEGSGGSPSWPIIRPNGDAHDWSLHYRPNAAGNTGQIEVSLDGESHTFDLTPGHRTEGAKFDRFGLFNIQSGGHHVEIYLDDVSYTKK